MLIDSKDAIRMFVFAFPELRKPYDSFLDEYWTDESDGPGIYTFFGQLVDPILFLPLMTNELPDLAKTERLFSLFETLAVEGSQLIKDFVRVEIGEPIVSHPEWWSERVSPFIGPALRESCDEAIAFFESLTKPHLDSGARYLKP